MGTRKAAMTVVGPRLDHRDDCALEYDDDDEQEKIWPDNNNADGD